MAHEHDVLEASAQRISSILDLCFKLGLWEAEEMASRFSYLLCPVFEILPSIVRPCLNHVHPPRG